MKQILQVFLPLIFNRRLLQEIEIQNGGSFDRLLVLQIYDVIYIALLKNKRIENKFVM